MMGMAGRVMADMAKQILFESVAAAIQPESIYLFAGYDVATAFHAMYEEGLSWGGAAGLAASLYGAKASVDVGAALGIKARRGQSRAAGLGLDVDQAAFRTHLDDSQRAYRGIRIGSFSIRDWSGYPAGIRRPSGPFRLVTGTEYIQARRAADAANGRLHREHPEWKGMHIHEIHPIKYGGSPTHPANKIALPPSEHIRYNAFWSRLQTKLRTGVSP